MYNFSLMIKGIYSLKLRFPLRVIFSNTKNMYILCTFFSFSYKINYWWYLLGFLIGVCINIS